MTLPPKQVKEALKTLQGWEYDGQTISKTFTFQSFRDAMDFVEETGDIAEDFDHHPDIDIRHTKIAVRLTTHDAGGVTEKDLRLARRLEHIEPPEIEEDEEGELIV